MSFAKTLKVIIPGTIFAMTLASAGVAFADQTDRADALGQAQAFKEQPAAPTGAAAQVRNQTREQVRSADVSGGRADELGLAIAEKNASPSRTSTAYAATKNTGSNHTGQ